jgi:hypothetical protein
VLGFAAKVKLGCGATVVGLTVNVTDVAACSVPLVPVMVTVLVPTLAVLLAASVRLVEPVAVGGLKVAVTPLGKPLAVKPTLPVNPPEAATVRVVLTLAPCASVSVAGLAFSVYEAGGTVVVGVSTTVVSE